MAGYLVRVISSRMPDAKQFTLFVSYANHHVSSRRSASHNGCWAELCTAHGALTACPSGEVTDTISRVRTEQGLLTYLRCLKALGGSSYLRSLKSITRLRLQSELYSLTSPGARNSRSGILLSNASFA
eukprot:GHRR01017079.1.p2 GENE.GHRR01017079.1~~GHRR01017079.1.p2  ORF type:complete len:128 (+),score=14.86 GHRR01017079.1:1292-1675(+)